jgi:hypothetical protein
VSHGSLPGPRIDDAHCLTIHACALLYAALVSDVIEASIDNWLASFDGRALEIFTPYREGSMRYHAALWHNEIATS